MSASSRWLIGIVAVLVIASAASVIVALMAGGEHEFAEGTPERAVQRYLAAVADRDIDEAISFMSADLMERCTEIPRDPLLYGDWRFRASLEETVPRGDGVEVRVRMTEVYGSLPFDRGESNWSLAFQLVQEDGEWRFSEAPWPLYCIARPVPAPSSGS